MLLDATGFAYFEKVDRIDDNKYEHINEMKNSNNSNIDSEEREGKREKEPVFNVYESSFENLDIIDGKLRVERNSDSISSEYILEISTPHTSTPLPLHDYFLGAAKAKLVERWIKYSDRTHSGAFTKPLVTNFLGHSGDSNHRSASSSSPKTSESCIVEVEKGSVSVIPAYAPAELESTIPNSRNTTAVLRMGLTNGDEIAITFEGEPEFTSGSGGTISRATKTYSSFDSNLKIEFEEPCELPEEAGLIGYGTDADGFLHLFNDNLKAWKDTWGGF